MKARKLAQMLRSAGGDVVRRRGDHVIYRFPSGDTFALPQGGKMSEVSPGVLAKARRFLK